MKIIHFSDIHVWDLAPVWHDLLYPKRWLGGANLLLKRRKKFPPALGEAVVADILKQDADLVVFSGDYTTQSAESEFRRCSELFAPVREKWGARFFAIPGNHDRYTPKSVRAGFHERYFPYGVLPALPIRRLEIDGIAVVGMDNSKPYKIRSNGEFEAGLEEPLRAELQVHAEAGRRVILVGHFPYATPPGIEERWDHGLLGADRLAAIIAEFKPALYLHGHKHVRWVLRPPETPDTVCVDCGSAGMVSEDPAKQAGYAVIMTGADGSFESVTPRVLRTDGGFADEGIVRTW